MDFSSSKDRSNHNENEKQADDIEEENITHENRGKRKTPITDEGGTSEHHQPKKIMNTRFVVWNNFTRLKDNRDKCCCNYCQKQYGCKTASGTSHLSKHLLICKAYKTWEEGQLKSQSVIKEDGNLKSAKVSESVWREASNEMIVIGELPLSFIEGMAWRHLCSKANMYKPHSRRTATRDVVQIYVNRKAELKSMFLSSKQRVSLTTDIWVAQTTGASYMAITAHYIDASWRLKKFIIGFKHVSDHKGQTISTVLLECLADWGIEKICCVTVDNANANTSALKRFKREFSVGCSDALVLDGDLMHMRCTAHIINLIVRDGLADIDDNVSAIRNAVSYVRSSTNRLKSFELRVDSGKMTRGSVPLDVKTRWNSTFLMLQKAIKFRLAFDKMESEDKLYNDYFLEYDNEKKTKRIGPPATRDWNSVERLAKFLHIFYNSTLVVSASITLNSHRCYGEIVTIANNLVALSHTIDSELKKKAEDMLDKFYKYWEGSKNINKMLIVATVFDPTKKLQFAKLCFDILYGKDSFEGKEMYDSVFCLLVSLFTEYSSRYSKGLTMQSSQGTQTTSTSCQKQTFDKMDMGDGDFGYERVDFLYKEMVAEIGVEDPRDELQRYLKEPVENPKTMLGIEYDVLSFWKLNANKYPVLAEIARDVLAIQVSSVASESDFSTSGRIVGPHRSCLTHYMIEVLMCTEQWMKQEIKLSETRLVTTQQLLADIEMQDQLEKEFDKSQGED